MTTYNDLLSNKNKEEVEAEFQQAFDNWITMKDKKYSDIMWECVFRCCLNITKSIYKSRNVVVEDEDLLAVATDGCVYAMKFILDRGDRPDKLSSYLYLRVRKQIDDPKKVWYEQHIKQIPKDLYKEVEMEIVDENA